MTNSTIAPSETLKNAVQNGRWVARAGMLIALGLFLPGTVRPALTLFPSSAQLATALAYLLVAVVMFLLFSDIQHRVLLRGKLGAEVKRGNLAASIVAGSHAVGTGIVCAHCFLADSLSTLFVGAIFFVVAEVSLLGLSLLFRCLTYYADDQEILGENLAAALSYSGVVVALSIVVGHAVDGSFVGWLLALRSFGLFLLLALLLYPLRQIVVARLLLGFPITLRGGGLDRAVAQDRNWVVSLVEALGYLAAAFFVTGLA